MVQKAQPNQQNAPWHRRLTSRIVVSLAGFAITFIITLPIPGDNLPASLAASLYVAGIVFVAQFLFDVARRLDGHEDWFKKIHLASELFSLADAARLQTEELEHMTKLVRTSTRIASSATPLVQEFAQAEIKRLANNLTRLGDGGDLRYEGEDRDWLLGLTKVAQKSLQATSLSTVDAGGHSFIDGGLWHRDLGQNYLTAQRQAIKRRGVKIQRLFIIDREELSRRQEFRDELDEVLGWHLVIGVEVRVLMTPKKVRMGLRDFIIFDEVLCYESSPGSAVGNRDPIINTTTLVTDPAVVEDRRREFDDLWNADGAEVKTLDQNGDVPAKPALDQSPPVPRARQRRAG